MADLPGQRLILASGSPRRAEILSDAGIDFEISPADIDEDAVLANGAELVDAVKELALAKAQSVASRRSDRHILAGEYVLGADTIVVLDGEVLGKPGSAADAVEMLQRLNGKQHEVITGIAVVNPAGETHTKHVSTSVFFRNLDEGEIAEYVSSGSSLDKAGGYGIQDRSFAPVASYDECYLNVVGLPMCAASELLGQSGFPLSAGISCAGHADSGPADSRFLQ